MKNAIAALDPEANLPEEEKARLAAIDSMTLYELMQSSPFYDSDIQFERDRSPMRDIGL